MGEEDSDEAFEFLSRSSSRTFQDIENEGDTLRPASPVDAEKNSDSSTKIKTILSSSTRRPPKRIPTKRTTSITRVSHATSLKRATVSSASPVDEASSDGEAQDLGAGDDGDCQPQGRNRRTKRATCYDPVGILVVISIFLLLRQRRTLNEDTLWMTSFLITITK